MEDYEPDFSNMVGLSEFLLRKGKTGDQMIGKSKPITLRLNIVDYLQLQAIAEHTNSSIGLVAGEVIGSALPELVALLGKGGFDANHLLNEEIRKSKEAKS